MYTMMISYAKMSTVVLLLFFFAFTAFYYVLPVTMNDHFALYSRAMGRNWVYLFYPQDYTGIKPTYSV